jgi:type III restriction enzyme
VNIFGVPFTFLPHESGHDGPPPPPIPKVPVYPDPQKSQFEITWPNIIRVDHSYRPVLSLDWEHIKTLHLDASQTALIADLAPIIEGKPDIARISSIDLERLARDFRTQRIIFETARDIYDQMQADWKGSKEILLAQLVRLVEQFIRSDRIYITPPLFFQDELRRRLIITLNMTKVVHHIWEAIRFTNTERLEAVFDIDHPMRSTGNMLTWYTGKPCEPTKKSHINLCVYDSAWEASDEYVLEHSPQVAAWVKNDHLGFEILYIYRGVVRKYWPDFLIRLDNGDMLILETKGQEGDQERVKHDFLDEWVNAVNSHGGFGHWRWEVSHKPGDIKDILIRKKITSR